MGLFKSKAQEEWKVNYIREFNEMRDSYEDKLLKKQKEIELLKKERAKDVTSIIAKDYGYRLIKNKKYDDNNYDEYDYEFNEFFKNKSLTSYSSMLDLIVYFDYYNRHQTIKNFVKNAKFLD